MFLCEGVTYCLDALRDVIHRHLRDSIYGQCFVHKFGSAYNGTKFLLWAPVANR